MYRKGKRQYPVIAPQPRFVPKADPTGKWKDFLDHFRVANSATFHEWEIARDAYVPLHKNLMREYKKWREQTTKQRTTLLETARPLPDQLSSRSGSPFKASNERAREKSSQERSKEVGTRFDCRQFLADEIARMQKAYKNTAFAQTPIDRDKPEHEQLLNLIVSKLGNPWDEGYYNAFAMDVAAKFKGLGLLNSQPRAPGKPGGPEGLGLLVNWAEDFARRWLQVRVGARA